jgi:hypothetical protein
MTIHWRTFASGDWRQRIWYFRIADYGLHFQWSRDLSFSERMGIKNYLRIGNLVIRTLKPERP